jgi:diphthine synthase
VLWLVGLGLWDLGDVSLRGLRAIREADSVFLEGYTSRLGGASVAEMEAAWGTPVTVLSRAEVESRPDEVLAAARAGMAVLLVPGDPMVSTTHIDLRMRAHAEGIETRIVHGASIATAAPGLAGLQNYRFGPATSLPFPHGSWRPTSPVAAVRENLERELHTLVYLDIQPGRCMLIPEALDLLEAGAADMGFEISLYVGCARAGSPEPVVAAGAAERLRSVDFGGPLHILIVPGALHVMEREYLEAFAGL